MCGSLGLFWSFSILSVDSNVKRCSHIFRIVFVLTFINYSFFGGSVVFKGLAFGVPFGGSEFFFIGQGGLKIYFKYVAWVEDYGKIDRMNVP